MAKNLDWKGVIFLCFLCILLLVLIWFTACTVSDWIHSNHSESDDGDKPTVISYHPLPTDYREECVKNINVERYEIIDTYSDNYFDEYVSNNVRYRSHFETVDMNFKFVFLPLKYNVVCIDHICNSSNGSTIIYDFDRPLDRLQVLKDLLKKDGVDYDLLRYTIADYPKPFIHYYNETNCVKVTLVRDLSGD